MGQEGTRSEGIRFGPEFSVNSVSRVVLGGAGVFGWFALIVSFIHSHSARDLALWLLCTLWLSGLGLRLLKAGLFQLFGKEEFATVGTTINWKTTWLAWHRELSLRFGEVTNAQIAEHRYHGKSAMITVCHVHFEANGKHFRTLWPMTRVEAEKIVSMLQGVDERSDFPAVTLQRRG